MFQKSACRAWNRFDRWNCSFLCRRLRCNFHCRFVVDKGEITGTVFTDQTKSLPAIGLEIPLIHYFLWLLPSSENPSKVQRRIKNFFPWNVRITKPSVENWIKATHKFLRSPWKANREFFTQTFWFDLRWRRWMAFDKRADLCGRESITFLSAWSK